MKLHRLELTNFRGSPGTFARKFNDNNYFVYAENGRGKSTIADAIEFLVNGDLERFHREGCTLESDPCRCRRGNRHRQAQRRSRADKDPQR